LPPIATRDGAVRPLCGLPRFGSLVETFGAHRRATIQRRPIPANPGPKGPGLRSVRCDSVTMLEYSVCASMRSTPIVAPKRGGDGLRRERGGHPGLTGPPHAAGLSSQGGDRRRRLRLQRRRAATAPGG
jgi:hypothetical protein